MYYSLSYYSIYVCCQCLETLTSRQMDMQLFIADGCKEALLEEKRRFCFLVDKHCMFSYQFASFHDKVQNTPAPLFLPIRQHILPALGVTLRWPCLCGGEKRESYWRKPSAILNLFKTPARAIYSKTHNLRTLHALCYHSDENLCVQCFSQITHVFF